MRGFLVLALVLFVSACGNVEWPPRGYGYEAGPRDINTPPPPSSRQSPPPRSSSSSRAFVGANAVIAGQGDTVYALSRRHRVPVRAIIQANRLQPPYHLNKGQRVVLPRGRQHVVSRGETVYGIARQYAIDPYDLARTNGLKPPYGIQAGQKLVLTEKPRTLAPKRPARGQVTTRATPAVIPRAPASSGKGFLWPVKGRVVSGFGTKAKGLRNDGINIAARRGASVKAAENGVVVYAGNELRGFGNLILVKHSGGWVTAYAHVDKVLIKRGDKVAKGHQIATVGSTGGVKSPQLHFELRRGRTARDPQKYLRGV
ncbi:MAG: M23 family metallopeptidase [Proteobacteria bacterium]|nr:M23 family metallopeptidase [Pseudomonadota bacterium]